MPIEILEGDDRIVTFANGLVAREVIVDVDDQARRLSYSARSEHIAHHNASFQVFADGEARCRVVWIADVLPHEIAASIEAMMDQGVIAMKSTLADCPVPPIHVAAFGVANETFVAGARRSLTCEARPRLSRFLQPSPQASLTDFCICLRRGRD